MQGIDAGDRCLYPPSYSYLGNQNAVGNLESHQPQRFEGVIELQAYAARLLDAGTKYFHF